MRERLVTPDAVYGTVLFVALIAALTDDEGTEPVDLVQTLIFAVLTQIVFWVAHVFAGTVAGHGAHGGEVVPLGTAIARAARHSLGLLYGPVLPAVPLILGAVHAIDADTAVDLSFIVAMLILGVLGFLALADRGSHIILRILGGIGSAFLGLLIILLNAIVH